jgi:hypothetical protein
VRIYRLHATGRDGRRRLSILLWAVPESVGRAQIVGSEIEETAYVLPSRLPYSEGPVAIGSARAGPPTVPRESFDRPFAADSPGYFPARPARSDRPGWRRQRPAMTRCGRPSSGAHCSASPGRRSNRPRRSSSGSSWRASSAASSVNRGRDASSAAGRGDGVEHRVAHRPARPAIAAALPAPPEEGDRDETRDLISQVLWAYSRMRRAYLEAR